MIHPVALLLVALVSLPVIRSPTGAVPEIDLTPYPAENYGGPLVKVYPSYEESDCRDRQAVEEILGEGLDRAFETHWRAMLTFVGEFGDRYIDLLRLRLEKTSDRGEADVIVKVEEFEEHTSGGYTLIYSNRQPTRVVLACNIVENRQWRDVVILHELYHALGLGHVNPPHDLELMGSEERPPPYPSSLDALALWELWFSGNKYRGYPEQPVFRLPPGFPYVLLVPYEDMIEQLSAEVTSLRRRNNELKNELDRLWWQNTKLNFTLQDLQHDLTVVREELEAAKALAGELSAGLEAEKKRSAELASKLEAERLRGEELSATVKSLEERLATREREAEELGRALGERERQVTSLVARVAELQRRLEQAEAWGQAMFYLLIAAVPLVITIAAVIAAVRGRPARKHYISRGGSIPGEG